MTDLSSLLQQKRLRAGQMAAAAGLDHTKADTAQALAGELPQAVERALLAAAENGDLVARFKAALGIATQRGLEGDEALRGAVYAVLQDQGVQAGKFLLGRAEDLRADAHRAEGAGRELLAVAGELEQLLAAAVPSLPLPSPEPDPVVVVQAEPEPAAAPVEAPQPAEGQGAAPAPEGPPAPAQEPAAGPG